MRVLLGTHTVDPTQGGEGGTGWGWAESLARNPAIERVEVVAHPQAREAIEQRLTDDSALATKLHFHWVLPPKLIDPWKGSPPGKKVWHRLLLHYQLWQLAAERAARPLVKRLDVAHHVTLGSIYLRTFVTELPLPYIIGPVGGGQAASTRDALMLLKKTRDVHSAFELVRSLLIRPMGRRSVVRRRLSGASAVLCANSQTLQLARRYQPRSELMIDGGIDSLPTRRAGPPGAAPIVLWVGKLEARKDPLAALDVAEALRTMMPAARLLIAGTGWLSDRMSREIARRSLSGTVDLAGHIPFEHMDATYASASVFLFTSLRDTFGVQNLEAMTYGLPIVFRDSSGVSVSDFAGPAAIPVANRDGWATKAALAITELLQNPRSWQARSDAAITAAQGFTWAAKAERAVTLYEQSLR